MCNYFFCRLYTHTDNDIVPVDPYCSHELVVYLQSTAKLLEICQNVFPCGIARDVTSSVASESLDLRLWLISVSRRVYSPFENLWYQGVPAFGRWIVRMSGDSVWMSSILSVLRRSITFLLHPAWGPNPPDARESRLCRLHSSIVCLSIIDEECGYRVPQPLEVGARSLFQSLC